MRWILDEAIDASGYCDSTPRKDETLYRYRDENGMFCDYYIFVEENTEWEIRFYNMDSDCYYSEDFYYPLSSEEKEELEKDVYDRFTQYLKEKEVYTEEEIERC